MANAQRLSGMTAAVTTEIYVCGFFVYIHSIFSGTWNLSLHWWFQQYWLCSAVLCAACCGDGAGTDWALGLVKASACGLVVSEQSGRLSADSWRQTEKCTFLFVIFCALGLSLYARWRYSLADVASLQQKRMQNRGGFEGTESQIFQNGAELDRVLQLGQRAR